MGRKEANPSTRATTLKEASGPVVAHKEACGQEHKPQGPGASVAPAIMPTMAKYPTQQAARTKRKASHAMAAKPSAPCILYVGRCTSRDNKGTGTRGARHITM
ncbi:hypothetical protein V6N13_034104 [Hibiscus sabdariffa]